MKIFETQQHRRDWSPDERLVLDQIQRLADDLIAPNAARYDETGEFPWDNIKALNEMGATRCVRAGGLWRRAPMSYRLYLEVVKKISEACASTGIIYATTFHGMKPLIDFGTGRAARAPAAAHRRRRARLAGDHRTQCRLGCDRHDHELHARRAIRSSCGVARLSSATAMSPTSFCCSANGRRSRTSASRSRFWCSKRARRASRSSASKTRWAIAPPRPRRLRLMPAACRAPICSASRATACRCC